MHNKYRHFTEVAHSPSIQSIALLLATALAFLSSGYTLRCIAADTIEVDHDVLSAQQKRIETMRKAAAATISIFGLDGGGGGSGVIITPDGYALTNYHVSSACGDHMRCGLNDGRMYDAVIVGVDATGDVSLIKLLGRDDFPTAPLADSNRVRVGQWCFSAGNPFVLASNLQPSISLGLVSGVNRYQYPAGTLLEYADCIQTDAAVNPGNSGGPLFNLAGEVIGINGRCSFEKRGRINVGVGYAISSNQIKYFLGVLKSGRLVDHATLGATVSTDNSDEAQQGKVLVSNILSSSDAYRRGLRYGDEVLSLADREVQTTNTLKNILGTLPKNWRVPIVVRRDGKRRTLLVRLEGVHTEKQLIDLVSPEKAPGGGQPERMPRQPKPGESPETPPKDSEIAKDIAELPQELRSLVPDKAKVSSQLKSKPGFANFYFNELRQNEIWTKVQKLASFNRKEQYWSLKGSLAGENTQVTITLTPSDGNLLVGNRSRKTSFARDVSDVVGERRETGILVALRALQQYFQLGPSQLGDSIYVGTAPVYQGSSTALADQAQLDVLQTLWFDATVNFSHRENGEIALVEVFGDSDKDPIELYLDKYTELEGQDSTRKFPSRLRLQFGTEPLLLIDLDKASFASEPFGSFKSDLNTRVPGKDELDQVEAQSPDENSSSSESSSDGDSR